MNKETDNTNNRKYDWLVATCESIGKLLFFFFTQPYRGIFRRIKENPNHLLYILFFQTLGMAIGYYWGFLWLFKIYSGTFWAKVFGVVWFKHIKIITFLFIGHTYCFIWRMPQLRRESILNKAFDRLGIVPDKNGEKIKFITDCKVDEDQRCIVLKSPGVALSKYTDKKEDIEAMTKKQITDISFGRDSHIIKLTYRDKIFPKNISYEDFYKNHNRNSYEFAVGASLNGKKIFSNLSEMIHMLVAGETGGGKSTFLKTMITDLLKSPKLVRLILVDLKGGVEFQQFKDNSKVKLIKELDDLDPILEELNKELDRRLSLLESTKTNDIQGYEELKNETFPRIVLIVDECAEIFLRSSIQDDKVTMNEVRFNIGRLARLSRAVGIHLVLATQRADKQAIDMQTKDNLVSRLCFRVNNDYASQMVLRDGRAAKLPKIQGRAIWKLGNEVEEVQCVKFSASNC